MVVHFCFHHFFDRPAQNIFERFLDVLGTLDVILFQQLTDYISFSFRHFHSVYIFLVSCHFLGLLCFYFIIDDLLFYLQKLFLTLGYALPSSASHNILSI